MMKIVEWDYKKRQSSPFLQADSVSVLKFNGGGLNWSMTSFYNIPRDSLSIQTRSMMSEMKQSLSVAKTYSKIGIPVFEMDS